MSTVVVYLNNKVACLEGCDGQAHKERKHFRAKKD
jgi:hypothetical protein